MTRHLHLKLHISEPWNFESEAGTSTLSGWTIDHADEGADHWEVQLDQGFDYHDHHYARLLIGPRYVGERIGRIFDAVVGFPVRMAHRTHEGTWAYAFAGTVQIDRERQNKQQAADDAAGPDGAPQGEDE
ncbi:MAG: hypothetical protein U5M50_15845 [Sphingobium sp.]|nr:hypothetical protein [Sphingobium sp.]